MLIFLNSSSDGMSFVLLGPSPKVTNCPDPGMPANGAREGENFNTGQAVTYSCSAGHKLKGSTIRVCQSDGEWSDTLPSCEGKLLSYGRSNVHLNQTRSGENVFSFSFSYTVHSHCPWSTMAAMY